MGNEQQNPRLTTNSMARIMENVDLPSYTHLQKLGELFAKHTEDATKGLQQINMNMAASEQLAEGFSRLAKQDAQCRIDFSGLSKAVVRQLDYLQEHLTAFETSFANIGYLQERMEAFESVFANADRLVQGFDSDQIAALQRAIEEHSSPQPNSAEAFAVEQPDWADSFWDLCHRIYASLPAGTIAFKNVAFLLLQILVGAWLSAMISQCSSTDYEEFFREIEQDHGKASEERVELKELLQRSLLVHHPTHTSTANVRMRAEPSTDSPIIARLATNQTVQLIETTGNWGHVHFIDHEEELRHGWVWRRYLQVVEGYQRSPQRKRAAE